MSKKRILWLLNHTTLRDFEVPMLIQMGFEVFCPKIYQHYFGDLSASITFKYDASLSIPQDILEAFNQVDFYENVPYQIKQLMNQYFDIAIFGAFSAQVNYLADCFHGILLMHAFGLEKINNYGKVFMLQQGVQILDRIEGLGSRFFFGQAYENLVEVENGFFKNRCIDLPIGLVDAKVTPKWTGGDHRILFICPKINTNEYFNNIYKKFLKDFSGFDYLIGGSQLTPVTNNPKVMGFVPADQYEYNMTQLDVMFYHSQEPRHLHYHPLEAVKNGMPLLFMAEGMLDFLGGEKLPGRCTSIKEARKKMTRIFDGDQQLIQKIVESQPILLEKFTYEYCQNKWIAALQKIEKSYLLCDRTAFPVPKKIAIILPAEYTGGVLDYTIRFVKAFIKGLEADQNLSQLTLLHLDHENYKGKNYFKELKELGVLVDTFHWKQVDCEFENNYYALKDIDMQSSGLAHFIPSNKINYLSEFDYLIFMSDMVPENYMNTRPYSVVAHDYLQRYIPSFYKDYYEKSRLEFQRKANFVFVTSESTMNDAINYAGIARKNLVLTPLLFEKIIYKKIENLKVFSENKTCAEETEPEYFLWSTNSSEHKNHKIALEALAGYYENGGRMKCVITGANSFFLTTEIAGETEYAAQIRTLFSKYTCFKNNVFIKGNVDKNLYFNYLQKAVFLFHPGYGDNGNGSIFDAAYLGTPSLSADYPAMRYMNEHIGLNVQFFNYSFSDELTDALLQMEKTCYERRKQLPTLAFLDNFTIEKSYKTLYQVLKNTIYF